jgi:hypothetical protein
MASSGLVIDDFARDRLLGRAKIELAAPESGRPDRADHVEARS